MERKFDSVLGGISIEEFAILANLSSANEKRMKRVELAKILWLTPVGLTRITLSLEQRGLISRDESKRDARLSSVILEIGGERKLAATIERAEKFMSSIIPDTLHPEIEKAIHTLGKIDSIL